MFPNQRLKSILHIRKKINRARQLPLVLPRLAPRKRHPVTRLVPHHLRQQRISLLHPSALLLRKPRRALLPHNRRRRRRRSSQLSQQHRRNSNVLHARQPHDLVHADQTRGQDLRPGTDPRVVVLRGTT